MMYSRRACSVLIPRAIGSQFLELILEGVARLDRFGVVEEVGLVVFGQAERLRRPSSSRNRRRPSFPPGPGVASDKDTREPIAARLRSVDQSAVR